MSRLVFSPSQIEECLALKAEHPQALFFHGGTDVLVHMRAGRLDPPALICLDRIRDLKFVRDLGNAVDIGAGMTHEELLTHSLITREVDILARAIESIGSPPIRRMGTIGGNICTASPAGDSLPPLCVLEAEVTLRSTSGDRTVPISRFITGPGRTDLKPGEILFSVRVPKPVSFDLRHFEKVGLRKALACSVVSLAALIRRDENGLVKQARLAWGSVGPTVIPGRASANALVGRPLARESLGLAAEAARQEVVPIDDVRADAGYRRSVAGNLLFRLLDHTGPSGQLGQPDPDR